MNKKGITLIEIIIIVAIILIVIAGLILALTPSDKEKSGKEQDVKEESYIKMKRIAGKKDSCVATLYLPNGTTKEYKIDMCGIDRGEGFVQFQSNGKYVILQGTISLEER